MSFWADQDHSPKLWVNADVGELGQLHYYSFPGNGYTAFQGHRVVPLGGQCVYLLKQDWHHWILKGQVQGLCTVASNSVFSHECGMPYFILDSSGSIRKNYSISLFAASLLVGRLLFQQWHPYFDILETIWQQLWYEPMLCFGLSFICFGTRPENCNPCESRGHLFCS